MTGTTQWAYEQYVLFTSDQWTMRKAAIIIIASIRVNASLGAPGTSSLPLQLSSNALTKCSASQGVANRLSFQYRNLSTVKESINEDIITAGVHTYNESYDSDSDNSRNNDNDSDYATDNDSNNDNNGS